MQVAVGSQDNQMFKQGALFYLQLLPTASCQVPTFQDQ